MKGFWFFINFEIFHPAYAVIAFVVGIFIWMSVLISDRIHAVDTFNSLYKRMNFVRGEWTLFAIYTLAIIFIPLYFINYLWLIPVAIFIYNDWVKKNGV